ncbi:MAG: type II toxin-antitoxin system VapC family toxin [Alphaproteobacteria bacterium]|nr:type II toxin-antitoxin system VapC family toxin [Alphaproteobacteria bacterium]
MTTDFLLDTNVVSEATKPRANDAVLRWTRSQPVERAWISTVTLAELANGIETAPAAKQEVLAKWLHQDVRSFYARHIMPVDERVIRRALALSASARRAGRGHSMPDLLIAATALEHGMTVATRNARDFVPLGVPVFDPWAA